MISFSVRSAIKNDRFIPVVYNDSHIFRSISHLTVDFETVLKDGINGIKAKAEASYKKYKGTPYGVPFAVILFIV